MTTSPSSTSTSGDGRVRPFPSGSAYVEALQDTALCFRGTDLAGAEVRVDALGRPRAISGNFAGVFSLTAADGTRCAVKCFTREVREQATRYRAVGEHLARLEDDWVVGFDYLGEGILVEGARYPVLRMEWVEAVNLIRWIEGHLDDPAALADLAERFADLVARLAAAGVGHGDLQHGNLLVRGDGSLKLVDYDGMYVPALAGLSATETGHRNYQSPDRTGSDFGPEVDRFSSWVVYLSLVALAADPSLWRQLRGEDAEHLLLAEPDFADPARSFRLATLTGHPDARLRGLAGRFREVLLHHRAAPPPLEPLDAVSRGEAPAPAPAGLPSWLAERVRPHARTAPAPVRFSGRSPVLAVLTWVLWALLPLAVPAAVLGHGAVAVVDVSAALAWAAVTALDYHRRPERAQARAARAEDRRLRRARRIAAARAARLDGETPRIAKAARTAREVHDHKWHNLHQQHDYRMGAHERQVEQDLHRIDRDREAAEARRRQEEQAVLFARQKEHLRAHLAEFPVKTAGVEGVGPALSANLEAVGIRTAADFVGVRYETDGSGRVAVLVLADGRGVRVAGVGPVKAERIDQWRARLTLKAVSGRPISLTPAEERAILDRFTTERARLDARHRQVLEEAEKTRRELLSALRAAQAALVEELKAANTAVARTRVENDRALAEAAVGLERARRAADDGVERANAFRPITYRRYLRFLLTGKS